MFIILFTFLKTLLYIATIVKDKEVAGIIENVYSKFKLMLIKKDENSKNSLVSQLTKINHHLEGKAYRLATFHQLIIKDSLEKLGIIGF